MNCLCSTSGQQNLIRYKHSLCPCYTPSNNLLFSFLHPAFYGKSHPAFHHSSSFLFPGKLSPSAPVPVVYSPILPVMHLQRLIFAAPGIYLQKHFSYPPVFL